MRYAVAFASLFDNELTVEIVEAATWIEAIQKHSKISEHLEGADLSGSIEDIKEHIFNQDALIEAKVIS